MNEHTLSRETMQKIDKLVERVARKAGYSEQEEITYKEQKGQWYNDIPDNSLS